jgi:hypothetical protein
MWWREMANQKATSGSGDDTATNAPLEHPADNMRHIQRLLESLDRKFDNLTRPPSFRLADLINLAVIAMAIIAAFFTALGLASRMDDLRVRQSDSERRMEARLDNVERRLDGRFDRVETKLDRLSEPTKAGGQ